MSFSCIYLKCRHVCEVVRIDQSCIWVYIRDLYYVIVLIIILDEIQFLLEDFLSSSRVCYNLLCVCFRTSLCFFMVSEH